MSEPAPRARGRRCGRGRAAARPARDAVRVHGLRDGPHALFSVDEPIANSSVFVFPSRTPGRLDTRRHRGVEHRDVALENPRPGGRLHAVRRDHVFERDRDAVAGRFVDGAQVGVAPRRGSRSHRRRPRAARPGPTMPRSRRPRASSAVSRSVSIDIALTPPFASPSAGRGTGRPRASALAKLSSSGNGSWGSSSAQTLTTSRGCDVGGTLSRSSSETLETASRIASSSGVSRSRLVVPQRQAREPLRRAAPRLC